MRYVTAAEAAPPGASSFEPEDVARLSPALLNLAFEPGPASAPLEDAAAALGLTPDAVYDVASRLPPERGERLLRLSQRSLPSEERLAARRRLVGGLFWLLVYELRPELWDRLAAQERISESLLAAIPVEGRLVVDVAAGSGRLSIPLAARARLLVAVEPAAPLRALLRRKLPAGSHVVAGMGQRLPVRDGAAGAVVSCATFGPDHPQGGDRIIAELERACAPGGVVAMVGPEAPDWWAERGFRLDRFPAETPRPDPELVEFFGPLCPPDTLLSKRL